MFLILCLSTLLVSSFAQEDVVGSCRNFKPMPDFDAEKIKGHWYEIGGIPNVYQLGTACTNANFTVLSNGSINILLTSINEVLETTVNTTGVAIPEENRDAGVYKIKYNEVNDQRNYTVTLLLTDYENYSVLVGCQNVSFNSVNYAWVFSRNKFLKRRDHFKVMEILRVNRIPESFLWYTNFRFCPELSINS